MRVTTEGFSELEGTCPMASAKPSAVSILKPAGAVQPSPQLSENLKVYTPWSRQKYLYSYELRLSSCLRS